MSSDDRAAAAWAKLNERQRIYMRVLYDADQAAERHEKTAWRRRPAEEWRWLDYGLVGNNFPRISNFGENFQRYSISSLRPGLPYDAPRSWRGALVFMQVAPTLEDGHVGATRATVQRRPDPVGAWSRLRPAPSPCSAGHGTRLALRHGGAERWFVLSAQPEGCERPHLGAAR